MTLVRWNPSPVLRPWENFDRLLKHFVGDLEEESGSYAWVPAVDINENEDDYTVQVDLPGLTKKDIHLHVKDNVLTISGERAIDKKIDDKNYHRRERSYGTFQRCFRLPEMVRDDKITAKFENGILTITLPKLEEVKPKEIEIKAA